MGDGCQQGPRVDAIVVLVDVVHLGQQPVVTVHLLLVPASEL